MSLQQDITEGWKAAMRSGDSLRKDTLAMLRAAIKNAEIDARAQVGSLDDDGVMKVIEREAKKRRDAIDEYTKAGRPDRAESEQAELTLLQEFLPEQLSEAELEGLVQEAIAESGATSAKDMGNVMKALMPKVGGRADGKAASAAVKKLLG